MCTRIAAAREKSVYEQRRSRHCCEALGGKGLKNGSW